MKTRIYANFEDFKNRANKRENGVSAEFAEANPNYQQDNDTNTACYDCKCCSRCESCESCESCYNCKWCESLNACERCDNCSRCSNMADLSEAKDQHY